MLLFSSLTLHQLPKSSHGGIRTHTPERIRDFKSPASAIPPHGQEGEHPGSEMPFAGTVMPVAFSLCGINRIRTYEGVTLTGLANRRNRPLCHDS